MMSSLLAVGEEIQADFFLPLKNQQRRIIQGFLK
jgi:hypothetical protein